MLNLLSLCVSARKPRQHQMRHQPSSDCLKSSSRQLVNRGSLFGAPPAALHRHAYTWAHSVNDSLGGSEGFVRAALSEF